MGGIAPSFTFCWKFDREAEHTGNTRVVTSCDFAICESSHVGMRAGRTHFQTHTNMWSHKYTCTHTSCRCAKEVAEYCKALLSAEAFTSLESVAEVSTFSCTTGQPFSRRFFMLHATWTEQFVHWRISAEAMVSYQLEVRHFFLQLCSELSWLLRCHVILLASFRGRLSQGLDW